MRTSLYDYIKSVQSSKQDFSPPQDKSEDYRYSHILPVLEKLELDTDLLANVDQSIIPWPSHYIFMGHSSSESLEKLPIELSPVSVTESFKKILLQLSQDFSVIPVKEDTTELHLTFASLQNQFTDAKVLIKVPKNSSLRLYIHISAAQQSLLSPIIFIQAEEHAQVDIFYYPEPAHNQGILYPFFQLEAKESSKVTFYGYAQGLPYHRLSLTGHILGKDADMSIRSAFYLRGNESADLFVRIFHDSPDSRSSQYLNALTHDNASMNFNGQIAASKASHGIFAYQMFKGLILGEKSRITARPQLDIEYYDLACSHGVSIGGVTQEELFYMKNRGLSEAIIYPLLTFGFLFEPLSCLDEEDAWAKKIKDHLMTF